ncbi:MAG: hypothetical protein WB565_17925 [Acidimicrobiales bacterium]
MSLYVPLFRLFEIRMTRHQAGLAEFPNPREFDGSLSCSVRSAVVAKRGYDAVHCSLLRLDKYSMPVTAAATTKHLLTNNGPINVSGLTELKEAHDSGTAVIVIESHIGVWHLLGAHLRASGIRVAGFSIAPARRMTALRSFGDAIGDTGEKSYFLDIPVPSPRAGLEALAAMRSGYVLLWNSAALPGMQAAKRVNVRYLGMDVPVSPTIARLAKQTEARLFLAVSRVTDWRTLDVQLEYRVVDDIDLGDVGLAMQGIYSAIEPIVLDNIDQWFPWRVYREAFLPLHVLRDGRPKLGP